MQRTMPLGRFGGLGKLFMTTMAQHTHHSDTQPVQASLAIDAVDTDIRSGIDFAAALAVAGISMGADHPILSAPDMGQTARRHFLHTLKSRQLSFDCLRTGAGADGLFSVQSIDRLVQRGEAAIALAHDFRCPLVSIYIGETRLAPGPASPAKDALTAQAENWHSDTLHALAVLAELADRMGIILALCGGSIAAINRLVAYANTPCVRGGLDSFRLLASGQNVPDAAGTISGKIALWICSDAQRIGRTLAACPLGEGQMDPAAVLRVLHDSDFQGLILLDPRHTANPRQTAQHDVDVLRKLLAASRNSAQRKR